MRSYPDTDIDLNEVWSFLFTFCLASGYKRASCLWYSFISSLAWTHLCDRFFTSGLLVIGMMCFRPTQALLVNVYSDISVFYFFWPFNISSNVITNTAANFCKMCTHPLLSFIHDSWPLSGAIHVSNLKFAKVREMEERDSINACYRKNVILCVRGVPSFDGLR